MDCENLEPSTYMPPVRCKLYGDKLVLRGLKFHGFHGVHEEEKRLGQTFSIDVDAWLDLEQAGKTDNLEDTVSYTTVHRIIMEVVQGNCFNLLETLANTIAVKIFEKCPRVSNIRVRVGKPLVAAKKTADFLGIEIFRTSMPKLSSSAQG